MTQSAEEIAQIIKLGTTVMLTLASVVIGLVLYFHQKIVKARFK